MRKINKKRLSRNVRLKHAPLKVLPLTTSVGRRHIFKKEKKERTSQSDSIPSSPLVHSQQSSVQCSLEAVQPDILRQTKKSGRRKATLTFHPVATARLKMNVLRWIFLSVAIALAIGVLFIMLQDGFGSMKNIIIYGVMGFFTFFMGYFGTIFAKDLLDIVMEKKNSRNEADIDT
jgi:hypothetical protein